jgi:hypothetical protein
LFSLSAPQLFIYFKLIFVTLALDYIQLIYNVILHACTRPDGLHQRPRIGSAMKARGIVGHVRDLHAHARPDSLISAPVKHPGEGSERCRRRDAARSSIPARAVARVTETKPYCYMRMPARSGSKCRGHLGRCSPSWSPVAREKWWLVQATRARG